MYDCVVKKNVREDLTYLASYNINSPKLLSGYITSPPHSIIKEYFKTLPKDRVPTAGLDKEKPIELVLIGEIL